MQGLQLQVLRKVKRQMAVQLGAAQTNRQPNYSLEITMRIHVDAWIAFKSVTLRIAQVSNGQLVQSRMGFKGNFAFP